MITGKGIRKALEMPLMGLGKCYLPRCWKIGCAMRSESRLPGEDGICGIRKGVEACYSVAEWLGNSEEAVIYFGI